MFKIVIGRQVTRRRRRGPACPQYTEEHRAILKARVEERLPIIEAQTGLKANGCTIRRMDTRWGSCNTRTHHINLSLMLADKPDKWLDYVIVHELAHTVVPNHGPEFKALMDRIIPDWRAIRKEMNGRTSANF